MIILQKPVTDVSEPTLARFLTRAKRAMDLTGDINVLLTSSRELRALNRRFRRKDKATDVLSFPSELPTHGFAGDIAISLDIARDNARRLGHAVADELKILMLHGVLHLAGYDHETDNGKMAQLEVSLRKELHLPVALIERSDGRNTASVRSRQPAASKKKAKR